MSWVMLSFPDHGRVLSHRIILCGDQIYPLNVLKTACIIMLLNYYLYYHSVNLVFLPFLATFGNATVSALCWVTDPGATLSHLDNLTQGPLHFAWHFHVPYLTYRCFPNINRISSTEKWCCHSSLFDMTGIPQDIFIWILGFSLLSGWKQKRLGDSWWQNVGWEGR